MDPRVRESLAMRLAGLASDLALIRREVEHVQAKPYDGAGSTLLASETAALNALALGADDVQQALMDLAQRLDRDLAAKIE